MTTSVPSEFSGGCACGAIRYACSGTPVSMVNCHCRACQRAGGAGYSPTVIVRHRDFHITRGQPRYHEAATDSGNMATRAFCGDCGSPLSASSSAHRQFVGIRAGSLDDPGWFQPMVDVWTGSAQPWDIMDAVTIKFPGAPVR